MDEQKSPSSDAAKTENSVPVITIAAIVIITLALIVVAGISALSEKPLEEDTNDTKETTEEFTTVLPDDPNFITEKSKNCSFEVSFDKKIFKLEETNNVKRYFGTDTIGARVKGIDSGNDGMLLIECSKNEPLEEETTADLIQAFQERQANDGVEVDLQIIDEKASFGGKTASAVKLQYLEGSETITDYLIFIVDQEAKVSYIVMSTEPTKVAYQQAFQNVLASVKLGVKE